MKTIKYIVLIFSFVSLLFANAILTEWKAEPGSSEISLQWKTTQEVNVDKFVIERSIDNRSFSDIGEVAAKGPGFQYLFVDDQLGKIKSLFYYRLRIVNKDGSSQHSESLPVMVVTGINRTWGSIKALFR